MNPPTPAQIKAARKKAGLTQTAAAKLICCSLRTWVVDIYAESAYSTTHGSQPGNHQPETEIMNTPHKYNEIGHTKKNISLVKKWWKQHKNVWEISQLTNLKESLVSEIVSKHF